MINIKENRCDFCGACITVCPPDCIDVRESSIKIHHQICIDCDLCIDSEQLYDEDETDSETICEWVNHAKWDWMKHWRCFMHGDICPDTCERCNE